MLCKQEQQGKCFHWFSSFYCGISLRVFSNLIFNLRLAVNSGKFDYDDNKLFGES